jgi:hypothetical protein
MDALEVYIASILRRLLCLSKEDGESGGVNSHPTSQSVPESGVSSHGYASA